MSEPFRKCFSMFSYKVTAPMNQYNESSSNTNYLENNWKMAKKALKIKRKWSHRSVFGNTLALETNCLSRITKIKFKKYFFFCNLLSAVYWQNL